MILRWWVSVMVLFLVRVPKFSLTGFSFFLEIASLKSMLNYWRVEQIHPNCFRTDCWWCQNLCCFCPELFSQKTNPYLTISGTPNLSTRFLTFTGNASNFLYFGSKIRFQLQSISRQQFSLNTDAFRGGDLHICERSCALDVQTELHFWGIDDLHLEVVVLFSSDLSRNSYL